MSLRIKQEAIYTASDWWKWSLWLDGSAKELDQVDYVVYTLHPTFPSPVRRITDRENNFRLDSAGWGEFEVFLDIFYKDGQIRKRKHWLRLRYPEPKRVIAKRGVPKSEVLPQMPKIFLSYGVADSQTARILRSALHNRGFEVIAAEDMAAKGVPFEQQVDDLIRRADAAIFIISGRPSLWVTKEIEMALDRKIRLVVPVIVGDVSTIPARLDGFEAVRIENPDQSESVVEAISQRVLAGEKSMAK